MTDLFEYAEAKALRDEGMQRAAAHSPSFNVAAYRAIEAVARRRIDVHVDEVIAEDVPTPCHPNAWGPVWARAIRDGVIQRTTVTRKCRTDAGKRAHLYPVYFSLIFDPRSKGL